MRVLFMGNNWLGWQIAGWLRAQGEEIVAAVLHPPGRRAYSDQIVAATGVGPEQIIDGSTLVRPETVQRLRELRPEIGVSVLFSYILRQPVLDLMPAGSFNIHPALLPYNRGAHPNVWSIIDRTPAGVTIHRMDAGIDTGDIVAQQEVSVEPIDTGETLYRKLERACLELFQQTWPLIRAGQAPRIPQNPDEGTCHRVQDVEAVDEIDLERSYPAGYLIDLLRARTFPPYTSAYFRCQGRKVHLRLQLLYDDERKGSES